MIKSVAKKSLKSHLETRGKEFIPTQEKAWKLFRVLNAAAFDNMLPEPHSITINSLKHCGDCRILKYNVVIRISTINTRKKLFIETVAHEMVHQWQYFSKGSLDHQADFKEWKKYFKKNFKLEL